MKTSKFSISQTGLFAVMLAFCFGVLSSKVISSPKLTNNAAPAKKFEELGCTLPPPGALPPPPLPQTTLTNHEIVKRVPVSLKNRNWVPSSQKPDSQLW